jgi:hypothetical protein
MHTYLRVSEKNLKTALALTSLAFGMYALPIVLRGILLS